MFAPMFAAIESQTVDQANYANHSQFGNADNWNGQTFTPSATTSAGAGFNLWAWQDIAASGILTIELWSAVPSNTGAALLASGSSAFSLAADQQSMIDVFWTPVAVVPGTQYFLAMNAPGSSQNLVTTWSYLNDAYTGGGAWFNYSMTSSTAPWTDFGPENDLTFREFSTVPEPASMVLLATGLLAVFGVARRKAGPSPRAARRRGQWLNPYTM